MNDPADAKQRLYRAIVEGEMEAAEAAVLAALQARLDPIDIAESAMIPALREVGDQYHCGNFFLPELLLAGAAAEKANEHLTKAIGAQGHAPESGGVVLLGTVQGDVHDIGKNIVVFLLQANGFRVIDLGRNVSPGRFLEAAEQNAADIIGLSAIMTTTLPMQRSTISLFQEVGRRESCKIIVGGAAATQGWADQIGADGYAPDAAAAVELCKNLLGTPARVQ